MKQVVWRRETMCETQGVRLKSVVCRAFTIQTCAGCCPSTLRTRIIHLPVQCNVVLTPTCHGIFITESLSTLSGCTGILLKPHSLEPGILSLPRGTHSHSLQSFSHMSHGQTPCLGSSSSPLHSSLPRHLLAGFSPFHRSRSPSKSAALLAPC